MVADQRSRGGALHGIRVVDLTRVLAGPLCTQMLSDHGADVLKIEPPGGDETRRFGPPFAADGSAAYFAALNRGKRCISLDLGSAAARDVLLRLLEDADVLIENFLPGTMERWGLGFEQTLQARHPRLVYCSVTGFGADGPLGGLPGYDAVLQAMCGLMSVNGDPASGPVRIGIPIVDHLTGYAAFAAILMALRVRDQGGGGQRVEATLYDSALSLLLPHACNWMASGEDPGLLGSAHPNIAPYDKFRTRDGEVFLGIANDAQFRRFCDQVSHPQLATDPRFATNALRVANRAALRAAIEQALGESPAAALCETLMRAGVPAGVVNTVSQALAHPHCRHRDIVVRRGSHAGLRSPMRLTGTPGTPGGAPRGFADDREEILALAGLSPAQAQQLRASGAAPASRRDGSFPTTTTETS